MFFKRSIAYIIDTLIVGIFSFAVIYSLESLIKGLEVNNNFSSLMFMAYYLHFVGKSNDTLGHRVFKLKLTNKNSLTVDKIKSWKIFFRMVYFTLSILGLGVGGVLIFEGEINAITLGAISFGILNFIPYLFTKDKQFLHDLIFGIKVTHSEELTSSSPINQDLPLSEAA